MPVLPSVCARAGKSLCQEVWHCLTGESPSWDHLDRWHQSHHNSPERYTLLLAAVYAVNTKCWLLHTGCGSKHHEGLFNARHWVFGTVFSEEYPPHRANIEMSHESYMFAAARYNQKFIDIKKSDSS